MNSIKEGNLKPSSPPVKSLRGTSEDKELVWQLLWGMGQARKPANATSREMATWFDGFVRGIECCLLLDDLENIYEKIDSPRAKLQESRSRDK